MLGVDLIESKLTDTGLKSINIFLLTNSFKELEFLISILFYTCLILSLSLRSLAKDGLVKGFGYNDIFCNPLR